MTSSNTPDYPDYPEYEFFPSKVTANGETLAQQYQTNDGTIVTDISISKDTAKRKKKLQELMNEYESNINVFTPEQDAQFESIANAKKESALQNFHSLYEPSVRKSREDYFSRLGTLDSTAYLDRYNALESTKQQAYADIANDYIANLDELKTNELARRYSYLNYLQNGLNSINNQNSNYINSMTNLSSSYTDNYNSYLSSLYGIQANAATRQTGTSLADWANIAGTIASIWS